MPAITRRSFQAALVALGLCLAYAPNAQAQSPSPDYESGPEHQSPAMMYTGMSIAVTGLAGLGVGTARAASLSQERGEFGGRGAVLIGGSVLIPSGPWAPPSQTSHSVRRSYPRSASDPPAARCSGLSSCAS
jgi:hypothetical protein